MRHTGLFTGKKRELLLSHPVRGIMIISDAKQIFMVSIPVTVLPEAEWLLVTE